MVFHQRALSYLTRHGFPRVAGNNIGSSSKQWNVCTYKTTPRFRDESKKSLGLLVAKAERESLVQRSPFTSTTIPYMPEWATVEVRRARPGDYEAVMDIKNVISELDYLPSRYHSLIEDPYSAYYICLVDGEAAGFGGIDLQDDQNTLMTRSFRVKEKFTGQGIPSHLRRKIYEEFKSISGDKKFRKTCSGTSRYAQSNTIQRTHTTLKSEKRTYLFDVDTSQMNPDPVNDDETKSITWEEFSHLLQIKPVKELLYPDKLMSASFWFYDAVPSNIRHMRTWADMLIVTKDLFKHLARHENGERELLGFDDDGNSNKDVVTKGMLGVVAPYFSTTHLCFCVNLAGRPAQGNEAEDVAVLLKPSLSYMRTLLSCSSDNTAPRKLIFSIVYDDRIISDDVFCEASKLLGLQSSRWELNRQYYFEQEFQIFSRHL